MGFGILDDIRGVAMNWSTMGWIAAGSTVVGMGLSKLFEWQQNRKELKDLIDETIVITGANTGIGYATASKLAARGATIVMGCRNSIACKEAAERIKKETQNSKIMVGKPLDLCNIQSILEFAKDLRDQNIEINALINNAGAMFPTYKYVTSMSENDDIPIEQTFATDYLGPVALSLELLPNLRAAATRSKRARIVNVASKLETRAYLAEFLNDISGASNSGLQSKRDRENGNTPKYDKWTAYANSKQAILLATYRMAAELQIQNEPITVNAVTPGFVNSDLGRWHPWHNYTWLLRWLVLPSSQTGAEPSVFAATSNALEGISGLYLGRTSRWSVGIEGSNICAHNSSPESKDTVLMWRLWSTTMRILGQEWRLNPYKEDSEE